MFLWQTLAINGSSKVFHAAPGTLPLSSCSVACCGRFRDWKAEGGKGIGQGPSMLTLSLSVFLQNDKVEGLGYSVGILRGGGPCHFF